MGVWDSPEFAMSTNSLGTTHAPGSPFYTLFTYLLDFIFHPFFGTDAFVFYSILFGSLAIGVVFLIIYELIELAFLNSDELTKVLSASLGSLCLAFSSTFWTNSTEVEVYSLSMLALSCTLLFSLKWYKSNAVADKKSRYYLRIIFVLLGISASLHPINVACVIPLFMLYSFKKYDKWLFHLGFLGLGLVSFVIGYQILYFKLFTIAGNVDYLFVNKLGWNKNLGGMAFMFLAPLIFFLFLKYIQKKKRINTAVKSAMFLSIVFLVSSYSNLLPLINSNTTNFNSVSTSFYDQVDYMEASRFGVDNIPIFKAPSYNAIIDATHPFNDGNEVIAYNKVEKRYQITEDGINLELNYHPIFDTYFPRLYANDDVNSNLYTTWIDIDGRMESFYTGGTKTKIKVPVLKDQFLFFMGYQMDWMYFRYLMWNFSGRQNIHLGNGDNLNGNWLSGISIIDGSRGVEIDDGVNSTHSSAYYYLLPFLLGLIGLMGMLIYRTKLGLFLLSLFVLYGIGIIIIINPTPLSVLIRERDYIFIGSFLVFSIFIGLSLPLIFKIMSILFNKLSGYAFPKATKSIIAALLIIALPLQMLAKNYSQRDLSNSGLIDLVAKAYLDSCPQNAILFTQGDNFTFPLWYLQEIHNYRTDVRVLNIDLLQLPSFIEKLEIDMGKSKAVRTDIPYEMTLKGSQYQFPINLEEKRVTNLKMLDDHLKNDSLFYNNGSRKIKYLPSKTMGIFAADFLYKFQILEDQKELLRSDIVFNLSKDVVSRGELIALDVIQANMVERPICFLINGKTNHYLGMDEYLIQHGLIQILQPLQRPVVDKNSNPKIVITNPVLPQIYKAMDDVVISTSKEQDISKTVLRRTTYFESQALLENRDTIAAINLLDLSLKALPNEKVPYGNFSYSMGKLYHRMGHNIEAKLVCETVINNNFITLDRLFVNNIAYPRRQMITAVKTYKNLSEMVIQLNLLFPERADYWKKRLEQINERRKIWAMTVDQDQP
ncbi:hypothetical protein CW736_05420 [Nonlabens sp. MB-3u-79]|nr:hypothetical protein CW736_05420 [Nonlabens sp. MB-3u-79]